VGLTSAYARRELLERLVEYRAAMRGRSWRAKELRHRRAELRSLADEAEQREDLERVLVALQLECAAAWSDRSEVSGRALAPVPISTSPRWVSVKATAASRPRAQRVG
jgi:hypothetical protein